jgi:hypothetical protein
VTAFRETNTRAHGGYSQQMVWLRTSPFSSAMDTSNEIWVRRSHAFSHARSHDARVNWRRSMTARAAHPPLPRRPMVHDEAVTWWGLSPGGRARDVPADVRRSSRSRATYWFATRLHKRSTCQRQRLASESENRKGQSSYLVTCPILNFTAQCSRIQRQRPLRQRTTTASFPNRTGAT